MGNFLQLFGTICIVLSAILVAIGWKQIVKGNKKAHHRTMNIAAAFAVLFFTIYVTRTILLGNTSFGGPENLKPYYIAFLIFHILIAITGVSFGVTTITYALKDKFIKHKKIGPSTAIIWFFSASTGVAVYILLYVIWEPGPTISMMKAIWG